MTTKYIPADIGWWPPFEEALPSDCLGYDGRTPTREYPFVLAVYFAAGSGTAYSTAREQLLISWDVISSKPERNR